MTLSFRICCLPVSASSYVSRALLVPAMLYFASNVTSIYALSYVRSYIFTAIMDSRIVLAAILSVVILNKTLSAEQSGAVVIIFCAATALCLEGVQVRVR